MPPLLKSMRPRARTPQEKPPQNPSTTRERAHLQQLEKTRMQQRRPTTSASSSSFQSLSRVRLFATRWTAAHQASLSITNSRSLPKLMSIESVMPSNHLIFCHPPFSSRPQSFPASESFPRSQFFGYQVAKVLEIQLQHQSFQ